MANHQPPHLTPHQQTFINIANRSFNIQPYPWQYGMGRFAIERISKQEEFKFICIRPTGGGKSLLYQVLALHVKHVTLCITPILALGADQMRKVLQIPDTRITAFHMDELKDDDVLRLKRHLEILHPENAVVILALPQFLNGRGKQFLAFLHRKELIRLVVMDKLHLSHHFAQSFREDFDQLGNIIFKKLPRHIPCVFMTATCSKSILAASERTFGFKITHKDWPTVKGMANRKQSLIATYTPIGIRYIYDIIQSHLGKNEVDSNGRPLPDKQLYYGNTRNSVKALGEKLEAFLDSKDDLAKYDVIVIHGHQSKEEKSAFLNHFSTCNGEQMNFRIACATSGVANSGIDCKDIRIVVRLDLPPSIWDMAQEMGQAGRGQHATSEDYKYFLFFSLSDLIYLFMRINDTSERCNDDDYRIEQYQDLLDVIKLLANPFKCHKQLVEEALGNPDGDRSPYPPCFKCSVCNVEVEMWPPLCKPGVRLVIFDVFASGSMISGHHTIENVSNAIRQYPDASKHLFCSRSTKAPSLGSIHKLIFILIAADIIVMKYKKTNNDDNSTAYVELSLAKVSALDTQRCLMVDTYWQNILLREPLLNYT